MARENGTTNSFNALALGPVDLRPGPGSSWKSSRRPSGTRVLNRYLKPNWAVLGESPGGDQVRRRKQLPRRSGEYLLEVSMWRHENRSTVMTFDRPLEAWVKLIGDVLTTTAMLDRFL